MGNKVHLGMHRPTPTSERVAFVRRNGRYHPAKQAKLKNSLLAAVGFLELANAMDFPANVWNSIPVPLFAAILMGIGGLVALTFSVFAFRDAILSRRNILLLRDERRWLKKRRTSKSHKKRIELESEVLLDVNFREIGTETIDRIGMDSFMGFGAVMVAIGTFMAIGGANPSVYMASNLLSGYIGNAPSFFYGAVNAGWSIYVWRRAHRQALAGARHLKAPDIEDLQKERIHTIKMHAILNGFTGLISGIAGIITATRWWGYVVLIPCIVSAIYCNRVWRCRLGYERPSILQSPSVDHQETIKGIRLAASAQTLLREAPLTAFDNLVSNPDSISCVVDFIVMHGFFEDFCTRLLKAAALATALFGSLPSELEIDSLSLLAAKESSTQALLDIAEASVRETGLPRFRDRQRFLLEKLGCQLCIEGFKKGDIEMDASRNPGVGQEDGSTGTDVSVTFSGCKEDVAVREKDSSDIALKESPTSIPIFFVGSNTQVAPEKCERESPREEKTETKTDSDTARPSQ